MAMTLFLSGENSIENTTTEEHFQYAIIFYRKRVSSKFSDDYGIPGMQKGLGTFGYKEWKTHN